MRTNWQGKNPWFALGPIIPNAIIIAVVLGVYFFLASNYLFPDWISIIYWTAKVIVGFEIIRASARSLAAPILTLAAGLLLLFMMQVYNINLVTMSDAWQLLIMAGVGFVIAILVRLV